MKHADLKPGYRLKFKASSSAFVLVAPCVPVPLDTVLNWFVQLDDKTTDQICCCDNCLERMELLHESNHEKARRLLAITVEYMCVTCPWKLQGALRDLEKLHVAIDAHEDGIDHVVIRDNYIPQRSYAMPTPKRKHERKKIA